MWDTIHAAEVKQQRYRYFPEEQPRIVQPVSPYLWTAEIEEEEEEEEMKLFRKWFLSVFGRSCLWPYIVHNINKEQ